jgi:hypothetical protein
MERQFAPIADTGRYGSESRKEFAKLAGACGTLRIHDALSFLPTASDEA